jgi:hypothetical protein
LLPGKFLGAFLFESGFWSLAIGLWLNPNATGKSKGKSKSKSKTKTKTKTKTLPLIKLIQADWTSAAFGYWPLAKPKRNRQKQRQKQKQNLTADYADQRGLGKIALFAVGHWLKANPNPKAKGKGITRIKPEQNRDRN